MTTWILVADEARARLFHAEVHNGGMEEVAVIEHPEGRNHPREPTDQEPDAGHAAASGIRHGVAPRRPAKEKVAREFARGLAELLEAGRVSHAFDELALVADPKFLELLRAALGEELSRMLVGSVAGDYTQATPEQIRKALEA